MAAQLTVAPDRPLRVLAWPAEANRTGNPYNAILTQGLRAAGAQVDEFTPGRLLRGGYDIWHAHWPDGALGRHGRARAGAGAVARLALASVARGRGTRVIWTVHNLRSHQGGLEAIEGPFWDAWTRRVDASIHLSESARQAAMDAFPRLRDRPSYVVPHPHYRDAYPAARAREDARAVLGLPSAARVVVYLGHIRPYKAVPALARAFLEMDDAGARLIIAGRPETPELADEIARAAAGDPRILLRLEVVPDEDVATVIGAADVVALPYGELLNSGAALLALSLDRPALVPDRGAMADLREAVGSEWVYLFSGPLTSEALGAALGASSSAPPPAPAPLGAFAPAEVARATLAVYRDVVSGVRGRG